MAHPSQNFPSLGQHTSSTGLPLHHPMQIGELSPNQDFTDSIARVKRSEFTLGCILDECLIAS